MTTKKMSILAIKTDQQSAKLVNPGEGALTDEAPPVQIGIEEAFALGSASANCIQEV